MRDKVVSLTSSSDIQCWFQAKLFLAVVEYQEGVCDQLGSTLSEAYVQFILFRQFPKLH